ncbi:MAG: EscU/YscU/HrcU family type III secretion system export apparatus switch protein [Selenomonadaceae bacterium]|nr:EscU/YscU/HrcU family type III secretion system export apparatus switch protein [Selenomonadaceae bacterium]
MDDTIKSGTDAENIKDKQAVALKYDADKDTAPRVVAKGKGHTAEHILEAAQKSSVPVYQNKTLVNMLMALDIDREIPPELYKAIAEVMAYVYKMDKAKGREVEERKRRQAELERRRRARRGR